MNRGKTQTSFFLVTLFFILPCSNLHRREIETQNSQMDRVYGDPNDADLLFAHYVIPDTDSQIYSGTAHMVQAWIDAGSPSNQVSQECKIFRKSMHPLAGRRCRDYQRRLTQAI